jgi:iron complex transport system substrate-binding protein
LKNIRLLLALALLGLCFGECGCGHEAGDNGRNRGKVGEPIKVVDIVGREVELKGVANRVVDLTGLGGTRMLIQLRAADKIVGATTQALNTFNTDGSTYSPLQKTSPPFPAQRIESVGSWNEPHLEKIISLKPDVILIGWSGKEAAERIFNQTGIPTVCIGRMDGRFDYDNFDLLGKIVGAEVRAHEIDKYLKSKVKMITDITDKIPQEKRKKVFFWINPNLDSTLRTNGIYDAIDYAGGINVAKNAKGIGLYEVAKEQVIAWNPDFIFAQSSGKKGKREAFTHSTMSEIKADSMIGKIPAILSGNLQYIRGPRSDWDTAIEAAEMLYIAKLLYPDCFAHLDVEQQGNEIFKMMYGADGLYVDMCENVGMYMWK